VLVPDQQGVLAQGINLDAAAIEQATGLKGQLIAEENVFKVTKPRTDVKIAVDKWSMLPFMGLGCWATFTPAHGGAMLMGDTVVFEDEVNPAMSAVFDAGLEVTALHNHFFFDEPKVFFMHRIQRVQLRRAAVARASRDCPNDLESDRCEAPLSPSHHIEWRSCFRPMQSGDRRPD
jgi:Domain of Unknown Function (DUF1259)